MTKQSLTKTVSSKMNVKLSSSPGRFAEKSVVNGFAKSSQRTIPAKIVKGVYDVCKLESVLPSNVQGVSANISKQHPKRAYNYSEAPNLKYLAREVLNVANVEQTAPSKLTGNACYKGWYLNYFFLFFIDNSTLRVYLFVILLVARDFLEGRLALEKIK